MSNYGTYNSCERCKERKKTLYNILISRTQRFKEVCEDCRNRIATDNMNVGFKWR